jgi:hypothetical protein
MRQTDIVKRAFQLTFRYPVLWIFGILAALTSGRGGNSYYTLNRNSVNLPAASVPGIGQIGPGVWITIALFCCFLLLVVIAASIIIQYVSRAALYRMVDRVEETGSKPTWREGFRLGWTNRTFRLFLLELLLFVAVAIAATILVALAASPLLLLLVHNAAIRTLGVGLAVALMLFVVLLLLVVALALSLLRQFWAREIVLADRGIGAAFASGYVLVRERFKDVGLMWLLLLAIGIGWFLVMLLVVLVVVLAAVAVGAGVGFSVYGITHSVGWAIVAGFPLFLAVMIVPLTFLGGLYQVFHSSAWTLAYREVVRPEPRTGVSPVLTPA